MTHKRPATVVESPRAQLDRYLEQRQAAILIDEIENETRKILAENIALKAYVRKLQNDIELLAQGTDLLSRAIQGQVRRIS